MKTWLTRDCGGIGIQQRETAPTLGGLPTGEYELFGSTLLAHFYDGAWTDLGMELPRMNSCREIKGLAIVEKGGE